MQGLAVGFLGGEGFFQIGYGLDVIGFIAGMEAIGELDDPAGFGCELDAQLSEGGCVGHGGRGWREGKGDSHGGVMGGGEKEHEGPSAADLGDFEGQGGAGLELLGFGQERCGALGTGKGDDGHGGGGGLGLGGGELDGAAEHLAIANGTGSRAIAGPFGRHCLNGPAELGGGGGDGLIRPPGTAMEEAMHKTASGLGLQGRCDAQGRPIKGTAATGDDEQGAPNCGR